MLRTRNRTRNSSQQLLPILTIILLCIFSQPSVAFTLKTFKSTAILQRAPFVGVLPARAPIKFNDSPLSTTTQLNYGKFIDVPDGFFTCLFPMLGIALAVSKQIARTRMEERAYELRLEATRNPDDTLTKSEWTRQEAANPIYSVYGARKQTKTTTTTSMDNSDIDYDPYYDDPYSEEELPDDAEFRTDKVYGDRVYDNGEIFYYDKENKVYFRQGSKPRVKNFWS